MLWASKQSFPEKDSCACAFEAGEEHRHDETCRLSYRPDITLPKHLPFGWGKHVHGCCCTIADYKHECTCACPCVPR